MSVSDAPGRAARARRRKRRNEARGWIEGIDAPLPYALVAETLGLDPEHLRATLRDLWRRLDAATVGERVRIARTFLARVAGRPVALNAGPNSVLRPKG